MGAACTQRDAARRRREEEAQLERQSPLQQYVELLSAQDESAWKEHLIGMGQGPEVPRLFKHRRAACMAASRGRRRWGHPRPAVAVPPPCSGKIRNKHLSKRDTEKMVKEIWKDRMNDPGAVGAPSSPPHTHTQQRICCARLWSSTRVLTATPPLPSAPRAPCSRRGGQGLRAVRVCVPAPAEESGHRHGRGGGERGAGRGSRRWAQATGGLGPTPPLAPPPPAHRSWATTFCMVCGSTSGMPTASCSCASCWYAACHAADCGGACAPRTVPPDGPPTPAHALVCRGR